MENRISLVTLGVRDLARARAFYEAMGWTPAGAQEGIVFFQANGMVLALWPSDQLAQDAKIAIAPRAGRDRPFGNLSLAYNVRHRREVKAELARARKAGAKILRPAEKAFWGGETGYFADPDGHLWEVAWNPMWTLDRRGNVKLPRR
jgi:catechol 2,3-dioxygenase-like lactoylglutathione lyase family enzyme